MAKPSSPPKRVLLVEDEPGLVLTLTDRLKSEGYVVSSATDGPSGLATAVRDPFDVILLDVMLPGMSGFDVCRDVRQRGVKTPIIMLTARGQVVDKVLGLKIGADDYLTKPFGVKELLARVKRLVQRGPSGAPAPGPTRYAFGDVEVLFEPREVRKNAKLVALSFKEFELLKYLIEHRGRTVSREELLEEIWGVDEDLGVTTRTVDTHVSNLRSKLGQGFEQPFIVAVHKVGYKFVEP